MLVSYNWLNEYVDLKDVSASKLAELLTKHGVAVDYVHQKGEDYILELDLTPNRSDCLSMIGVAYEVSAILSRKVTLPTIEELEGTDSDKKMTISITNEELIPYYGVSIIDDIQVGESPTWLKESLENAGIRSVNNIVDITNYVMLEYGQPLHVFDYNKVSGETLNVRLAKENETVVTLDGVERILSSDDIVIDDGVDIINIAGVMGGKNSEVDESTKKIILEYALFDPTSVRLTSKRLDLRSEASLRFEKGLDVLNVKNAGIRAIELLQEIANGIYLTSVESDNIDYEENIIEITLNKISKTLGFYLYEEDMADILDRLNFSYKVKGERYFISVPSRRNDITIEADMMEELARMYGYDNIPSTLPKTGVKTLGLTHYQKQRRKVKRFLTGIGLNQALTYTLTSEEKSSSDQHLLHPISEERSVLRSSIVPHLLDVVSYNKNRKEENIHLYEIGNVFVGGVQKEVLSVVLTGNWIRNTWKKESKEVDFFVIRGILDGLFSNLGLNSNVRFEKANIENMHPGRTASVYFDNIVIGYVGQVHPSIQENIYVFEIDLSKVLSGTLVQKFKSVSKYPFVTRDISLVVPKEITSGKVQEVIRETNASFLKEINVIDLYEGEHIENGKKSLTLSIKYENKEKTLTEVEINNSHSRIVESLERKLDAIIRK